MVCLFCTALASLVMGSPAVPQNDAMQYFSQPIDAMSVSMADASAHVIVRGFDGVEWTDWQTLEVDPDEQPDAGQPAGKTAESSLVTFPRPVIEVEVQSATPIEMHPIQVSHAPAHYAVAMAGGSVSAPRILSREEWGADESLRYAATRSSSSSSEPDTTNRQDNTGEQTTGRVQDCNEAYKTYPEEFKTDRTVRIASNGQRFLWPETYSKEIKMFVVHHTAQTVAGDPRPAVERVRALYQYHAVNRGWGDVGYNYIIDENGQIYEGRAGGAYVVAGHAYCHNVDTMGIALLGNFETEQPSQVQVQSLQWLLKTLADKYSVNLNKAVEYHGKTFSPISVHGDLLDTTCPGFYLRGVMDQVRAHVLAGLTDALVNFPVKLVPITSNKPFMDHTAERRAKRETEAVQQVREGLYAVGSQQLEGRPGQEVLISVKYVAGAGGADKAKGIGAIGKSNAGIGVWFDNNGAYERLRTTLNLPVSLHAWESLTMQLKVSFPLQEGNFTLSFGPLTYTLQASGRRMQTPTDRIPQVSTPATGRTTMTRANVVAPSSASSRSSSSSSRPAVSSSSSSAASSVSSAQSSISSVSGSSPLIRIRLSYPDNQTTAAVLADELVSLRISGEECIEEKEGQTIARGVVRIKTKGFKVVSWNRPQNRFRGTLECRVLDHMMVLINELPIEDYLKGLSEEPDTEPFEKQKAFAIAARSYALHYVSTPYRKFPGLPYDGSDNPVLFQKYGGLSFEENDPNWLRAVAATSREVLVKDGSVIRAPYFSSDDGRTRSPWEAGWPNFPNSEIYSSKDDPWCKGMTMAGHGVGMSGCGAEGQANAGKTAEQILAYYYPGTSIVAQ